jgi:PKD repeat protein
MKKFTLSTMLMLALALGVNIGVFGQLLLDENFSYPSGDLITSHGWTAHSGGGTQAITVSASGLTYAGYVNSGIGNAALLDNTGEDDNKTFSPQSSGSVYVSFMVNVTTTASGYFFHIGPSPVGTTFRGRVYMDATNHFGIGVGSGTAVYAASTFTPGTTYLLVLKYQIVAGTTNDQVSLFIFNSGMPAAEPGAPTIGPLTDASQADISPGSVALRQYSATQNLMIDGIRVGTSWSDIYANVVLPPPTNYPTAFTATPVPFGVNLGWTDATGGQVPTGYLILASNADNIVPPVNGTPVPNDPNLGAGSGALNVLPGVQAGSFANLISGTTYYFKIYPYTNTGSNIAYKTDGTPPSATATTEDWVMINQKHFNDLTFDPWDTLSLASNKGWILQPNPPASNYYAYINGFGGSAASDDWLISPSMDFNAYQNETFLFKTASNFTGPVLEVKISSNYITGADPSTATWTALTATLSPGGYVWTPSGNIDLSMFSGDNVHVAYRYISTSPSVGALWEVDDIQIYGKNSLLSTVVTNPLVTAITAYAATAAGDVTNDGGAVITERGICYSTSAYPTITGPKVIAPGTLGPFSCNLTGLLPNTTYHIRAYSTNVNGTAYGDDVTFATLCEPFAPLPGFWASNTTLVAGQTINFFDSTLYCPDTWNWSFVGGEPMTSTAQNPTGITYNYPGNYNVCLTVTNQYGTQTLCKEAYIHVIGPTNANLVMTEIMYNPPESGTDSLEFIEIYNNGMLPVDLQGFYFSRGVDFIFPAVTIDPAAYLVVGIKSAAMSNTFGITALQWTSGALSNQGEAIVLKDLYGYVIDSVYYKTSLPWDTMANGNGPSLELCDPSSNNNDPASWRHALEFQAINASGDSIWASPLAGCSYPPVADFSASDTTILQGESVTFTDASSVTAETWEWTFPGGTPGSFTGKTPPPVRYDVMGAYDVILKVSNNAGPNTKIRSAYIEVGPTGFESPNSGTSFRIYPNPSSGKFTVVLGTATPVLIRILDPLGNLILEKPVSQQNNLIETAEMAKGVYFVQVVSSSSSQVTTQKLIIQ